MGYRLIKDNVEKVYTDDALKSGLVEDGWKEVKEKDIDFNTLTVDQLKTLADEKKIEYDLKIKKEDIIKLLEGAV